MTQDERDVISLYKRALSVGYCSIRAFHIALEQAARHGISSSRLQALIV